MGRRDKVRFRSAIMGAMSRSLLHPGIYSNTLSYRGGGRRRGGDLGSSFDDGWGRWCGGGGKEETAPNGPDIICGQQGLEYVLFSLSKKGMVVLNSCRPYGGNMVTGNNEMPSSDEKNGNNGADYGTDVGEIDHGGEGGRRCSGHDCGQSKVCYNLVCRPAHNSGAVSVAHDIIDSCAFETEEGVDDAAIVDIPKVNSDGCMMNVAPRGEQNWVNVPLILQNTDRKDTGDI